VSKLSFDAANASGPLPFNVSEPNAAVWIPKERFKKDCLAREYCIVAVKSIHYDGNTPTADTARVFYKIVVKAPVLKKLQAKAKKVLRKIKSDDLKNSKAKLRKRFRGQPSGKGNTCTKTDW
jgi:hypothetical protein